MLFEEEKRRVDGENARTQEIVIDMALHFNPVGGYALVNELETRSLFSHIERHPKRILEVGCGTLPVTMTLPPSIGTPDLFIASDVSLRIVSVAQTLDRRPQYVVFSALQPAIRPGSLDLIVLNAVLHHMSPESNLLNTLRELLAPHGKIVMLEPNVSCGPAELIKWGLKRFFNISMEASPYGQFSQRTLLSLIGRAGLKVEKEWFASLLAFPLTGGQGRIKILPDSPVIFRGLVFIDEVTSRLLHAVRPLARFLHWRVLYLLSPID